MARFFFSRRCFLFITFWSCVGDSSILDFSFWLNTMLLKQYFSFSLQADSLEEAINIVNKNKYFSNNYSLSFAFVKLPFTSYSDFSNRYGNGATIFTTSGVAARQFQTEIEAGQVGCFAFAIGSMLIDYSACGFEPVYALVSVFFSQKHCIFPLARFSLPHLIVTLMDSHL